MSDKLYVTNKSNMIDVNINIITRTIPATPRSKNYPQGYSVTNSKRYVTTEVKMSNQVQSRAESLSQIDIVQLVRENRDEVIAALMDGNGVFSVRGSIRATGSIDANQTFE